MAFQVIGEEEIVVGFRFVGIRGRAVHSREEALEAFRHATTAPEVQVLIITESSAALIEDEVMQWQLEGSYPLIVEIPGLDGPMEGKKSLLESVREAIGISV